MVVRWSGLLALLIFVSAMVSGCGGGEESASAQEAEMPDPLVMGIIPSEENAEMLRTYEPMVEHLSKELGVEVEPYTATDYSGIVEAMRSGNVDVAVFGPFSYVLANKVAGAEAIAAQVTEEDQKTPTYHSLIITRPDSGIQNIEDLRGKTFSFVDPASTSGYLFPSKGMTDAGIDPEQDLKESTFAGGHDASALAVQNGTVDAGAVADSTYEGMVEEGVLSEKKVEVIWESQAIPESPVAVSDDLSPKIQREIKSTFTGMTEEKVGAPLGADEAVGYAGVSDSDYDVVRNVVDQLDLDLEKVANQD